MTPPANNLLSNVPPATADLLSYLMLGVVAVFLISGPVIVYIYYKKNKKMKAAEPQPQS